MTHILKFSEKTTNVVESLRKELLREGRLGTDPFMLHYHSYDSYDIENNKTPDDSICRFTIDGLKHIFPLLDIKQIDNEIYVEGELLNGFSPMFIGGHTAHIEYIKEIMLDIFVLYQNNEEKIPKNLYNWYYKITIK